MQRKHRNMKEVDINENIKIWRQQKPHLMKTNMFSDHFMAQKQEISKRSKEA
jgi:hypothetical protein